MSKKELKQVYFIEPSKVSDFLNISIETKPKTEITKGFRVVTEYESETSSSYKSIREKILRVITRRK